MSDKEILIEKVKAWVTLDNQMRTLTRTLTECRKEKKKKNEEMIQIMKANEIDNFDLKDGQIFYKKQTKREGLTQKRLLEILAKHPLLGGEQGQQLNQFIFESRKMTEKEVITRKVYEI